MTSGASELGLWEEHMDPSGHGNALCCRCGGLETSDMGDGCME